MEKRVKERFNDEILSAARRCYGIEASSIRLLDGFESFMFEFERAGEQFILRIGHSLRRNKALIQGEVDWINYLAEGIAKDTGVGLTGSGVARAILSNGGNLVETIPDGCGEFFLATAFTRAPGRPPHRADWTPEFCETYGRLLGRIHALSRSYRPPSPNGWRPAWDDPIMLYSETFLPPADILITQQYRQVIDHLESLPRPADGYGMIHQDAHSGNFFIDEQGHFTLFDFDDCCYGWYIYDIAMVLFYAVTNRPDPAGFTAQFMPAFLKGYASQNRLDPVWLVELPALLKLREIDLYGVIHRSYNPEELQKDPWAVNFLRGRKENIEAGLPYIDFDWCTLAQYM